MSEAAECRCAWEDVARQTGDVVVHPLWQPFELLTVEEFASAQVGGTASTKRRVEVVAPDAGWPDAFGVLSRRLHGALGHRALAVNHVGSTAVPDLWAKPIIDIDLIVADSAAEDEYLPALESCGFELVIREPEWQEHRALRHVSPRCNLHVFGPDAIEPKRHVAFRDWLTVEASDRAAYGALKRAIAASMGSVLGYNNAKAALIYEIYERIFAADPDHPHTPQPIPESGTSSGPAG